jgi:ribonuclease HI
LIWHNGLYIKLKNIGINGKLFEWIKDFLTNRTLQVRVSTQISDRFVLENGTAQGAIISPILFVIMINDLPDTLSSVESSLYADDTAIFCTSKNVRVINSIINKNLQCIAEWCDRWGFKISKNKTVAVLFSKFRQSAMIDVHIGNTKIKLVDSVKFLGVIFDKHLTWKEHIIYLKNRCQKRLNLLRSVSGQTWGAKAETLLIMYKTLIRLVIEYGDVAYDSASASTLKIIDSVRSQGCQALRICAGTSRRTNIAAIQIEMYEPPPQMRRLQHQIEYMSKIKAGGGLESTLHLDHWSNYYGKSTENNSSAFMKTKPFFENLSEFNFECRKLAQTPPWLIKPLNIDVSLTNFVSKKESPSVLLSLANDNITMVNSDIHIYTDASKTQNDIVGVGIHISDVTSNKTKDFSYRLNNSMSIFSAELTAIKIAVEIAVKTLSTENKIAIFSDSLSGLTSLRSPALKNSPNLVKEMYHLISTNRLNISLMWVPSHIGVVGNEDVDRLAAMSTAHPTIDIAMMQDLNELKPKIKSHID